MDDLEAHIAERDKPTIKNFILDTYYFWRRHVLNIPYYMRHIRWFYQRARYGVSAKDVWSFDFYLSGVIVRGLQRLRDDKFGHPGDLTEESWDAIMDTMIYTFTIARDVQGDVDILIPQNDEERTRLENFLNDPTNKYRDKYRLLSKEEVDKYNLGWKYFREYFFSLWQ